MEVVCFILIIMFPLTVVNADDQVNALIAFKNALTDPDGVLSGWDPKSTNPCLWFHTTCDAASHLTRIDLGDSKLAGSLVPDLGNLTTLQYLELFNTNLNGEIPKELGKLGSLVSLDLYSNSLTGSIPQELGNLNNLQWLRLNDNKLSGLVPVALRNLPNIKVLNISGNPGLCGPIVNVACPP